MSPVRERYGEAFWRAHHEAWTESELNQREYCEAYGIPLKAFGNSRAKFKAEPQPPARKVLYRRGGLSHALSHGLSHALPGSGPHRPTRARRSSSEVQRSRQTADTPGGDVAGCALLRGSSPAMGSRKTRFAAHYLVRGLPCERFTSALGGRRASLGVGADG